MNSEDVRNDPRMKAHWNKLARKQRILTWGAVSILIALVYSLSTFGCFKRWPIVIKGGGHGGGEGQTVEGGK